MDDQAFLDGLKGPSMKEWGDAATFFTGMKKQAYYPQPINSADGIPKGWLGQFEGSPLFEQAIALERQELTMEAEDLARRQSDQQQYEAKSREDQSRWNMRDQIRLKKRELELTLAEQQAGAAGGGEVDALPKHEAGMTTADVAPASGGDSPPATAPGTGMPKMARLHPIARHALIGAGIGAGAGAVGGALNAPEGKSRKLEAAKGAYNNAMAGAALGGLVGTARHTAGGGDFVHRTWPTPKGGGHLKNAMAKLGYGKEKSATFREAVDAVRASLPSSNVNTPIRRAITLALAAGGGALAFNKFRSRENLKGRSKAEVEAEKELEIQAKDGVDETHLGLPGKLRRRMVESGPGVSKALKQHPVMATAGGAMMGAQVGKAISGVLGVGAEALKNYKHLRGAA